ncbi:SID1 transmembrane family member 1 [Amphibalanus amphitrite]|uniref:SID1 transmembrane family member 1 n=1 Tax=Amphibalanus amphitrite TaxID=1232801 RepID=A0A6A4WFN9_AMPAM|nr:SID1 transmembrane family member 1 [Amphibalanus amphitrite]
MSVSRFMCPSAGERDVCYVTMGVGTSVGPDMGHIVYDYDLRLMELDADFWYLDTSSSPRGVLITPVMPALFQYRWPLDPSVQAVRVAVASGESLDCTADNRPCVGEDCSEESDADSCAFLAVHNPICPLTLTQADILSSAWHLSFTRCGTMVVRRKQFPDGFFVSVLLNSDDRPCCPRDSCSKNKTMTPRRKVVRTSVMKYEANFRAASAPSVMGAFFILIGLLSVCLRPVLARAAISSSWEPVAVAKAISSRILGQPDLESFPHGLELHENEESDTGVVLDTMQVKRYKAPIAAETVSYGDRRATEPTYVHFSGTSDPEKGTTTRRTTGNSLQVPGRETAPETTARVPNTVVLNPVSLQLTCALLIAAFGISNVAIDVAAERRTGNFDRCYRNDLCCHNGQVMPDLNHLLSNVPYIGAGIGFLLAVYAQWHVYEIAGDHGRGVPRGVPHDFNMFTTIGAALAIEGVTSGLYHVCPNNRNSHIDFFFIYYLCAAMGAKLFQTRRGVTTRFHYTPALLVATITLLGSLQQVPGMTPHSWQLAVVLTHFSSSFLWAAQMYLTGHVGLFVPWCWEITSDLRTRRLAAAHIILNGGLALWGLFWPDSGSDVFHSSTYALLYFSLNSGMYVFYYMIMKLVVCRERPPGLSVFNILVGIASAVPALYFFVIRKSYNTNESPALSRTVNHPCVMFDFYDGHDIWHFLSASALFFLMLGVLTLDDDLLATPRDRIPVF